MERFETIKKVLICILLSLSTATTEANVVFPGDTPSIEALIDAHKKMAKAEDLAIVEIQFIQESHSITKKAVDAYNTTRTVLNKRLSDATSYIQLASQLTSVTLKLDYLIKNYKDFTTTTYQYAVKKPFVLMYYTRAHLKLKKEIKHITELVAMYTASGLNILKATMEEKFQMLSRIEMCITSMNNIIVNNDLICRTYIRNGLKIYHIQDMLGMLTMDLTTEKLIARWEKETQKK